MKRRLVGMLVLGFVLAGCGGTSLTYRADPERTDPDASISDMVHSYAAVPAHHEGLDPTDCWIITARWRREWGVQRHEAVLGRFCRVDPDKPEK